MRLNQRNVKNVESFWEDQSLQPPPPKNAWSQGNVKNVKDMDKRLSKNVLKC